jgi:uncharacterized phage-like protein YoqJ
MALVIAITGHRPNKLGFDYGLTSALILRIQAKLQYLIDEYLPQEMISGMALGIDTLWAELALSNNIRLVAAIPDASQPDRWPKASQDRYYNILKKADKIVNVSGSVTFKMEHLQQRNEWMVDHCDVLIAVWDGSSGGTANCVKYAEGRVDHIVIINPKLI